MVVPVRDEGRALPRTLRHLARQVDLIGRPLTHKRYEIILLANNCADDSAAVAREFACEHPTLRLHVVERELSAGAAHIGTARRLLMDEARRRLSLCGRTRGVIASTDGDTSVAPTWIAATLAEIESGADAVSGRILLDEEEARTLGAGALRLHHLDETYRLLTATLDAAIDPLAHDPAPHHQHFGASFAVTAEAYRRVGGLPPVPFLEDAALYERLRRADARFRHSSRVRVTTSARTRGRVAVGLSHQLGVWSRLGEEGGLLCVESARVIARRATARRELRALWQDARVSSLIADGELRHFAYAKGVDPEWLRRSLHAPLTFGALWARCERRLTRAASLSFDDSPVCIEAAIDELRAHLAALRSSPAWTSVVVSAATLNFSAAFEEIEAILFGAGVSEVLQGAV